MGAFRKISAIAGMVFLILSGAAAHAGQDRPPSLSTEASQWHSSDHARVRLIRGGRSQDARDLAGLVIELEEGWHTYWRSPGAVGLPPTFNWEGSENVREVDIEWPVPQHIIQPNYKTFGYEDRVVLPLLITRDDPAAPARLNLAVGYAVCDTVCIPAVGFVSMALPAGRAATAEFVPAHREAIEAARDSVPVSDLAAAGIELLSARLEGGEDDEQVLFLDFRSAASFDDGGIIFEAPKGVRFGTPVLELRDRRRDVRVAVPVTRDENAPQSVGAAVTVTLIGGRKPVTFPLGTVAAE